MTLDLLHDNLDTHGMQERQPERRQAFDPVDVERRSGPGNRYGDLEHQAHIAHLMDVQLPAYLIQGAFRDGEDTPRADFEEVVVPGRHDRYRHVKFTEESAPGLAVEAWRIHAQGYFAMGFLNADALTQDGFLAEGIDKSQGDTTDYYLDINPENPNDCGTLRIINLAPGQTHKDLPAFQVSEGGLSDEGIALLEDIEHPEEQLKELAAMSRSPEASPMAVHEILRKITQEAQGKDEVWFFSIVSTTFESLANSLGEKNFIVIGKDMQIKDPRVNKRVMLRPALFYPDKFYDNIADSFLETDNPREKHKLGRSLMFFTEGIGDDQLSDKARQVRQALSSEMSAN